MNWIKWILISSVIVIVTYFIFLLWFVVEVLRGTEQYILIGF
jgi:hypothetical protein